MNGYITTITYESIIWKELEDFNHKILRYLTIYDKPFILKVIDRFRWITINFFDHEIINDKDIIKIFVMRDVDCLKYVDTKICNDTEIVEVAINSNFYYWKLLNYVNNDIKENKELMKKLLKRSPYILNLMNYSIRDDETIVVDMPHMLKHFSKRLRDNEKIVLQCLKYSKWGFDGWNAALDSISNRLKDNDEIILCSINNVNAMTIKYASERIRNNKYIMTKAMSYNPFAYKYIGSTLNEDKELALFILKLNSSYIQYVSSKLYKDSDIQKALIDENFFVPMFNTNNTFRGGHPLTTGSYDYFNVEYEKDYYNYFYGNKSMYNIYGEIIEGDKIYDIMKKMDESYIQDEEINIYEYLYNK